MAIGGPFLGIFDNKKVHVLQRTKQYDEFLDSSTVLLNGSRNHFDGCWDIPIAKVKMQDNHFRTPPIHPGLYPSDNTNQALHLKQRQSPCKRALPLAATVRTFAPLNPIPQHDDFDATLAEFKHSDKHVSTIAKPIINVIIRQDKLKSGLATYHHVSMFRQ